MISWWVVWQNWGTFNNFLNAFLSARLCESYAFYVQSCTHILHKFVMRMGQKHMNSVLGWRTIIIFNSRYDTHTHSVALMINLPEWSVLLCFTASASASAYHYYYTITTITLICCLFALYFDLSFPKCHTEKQTDPKWTHKSHQSKIIVRRMNVLEIIEPAESVRSSFVFYEFDRVQNDLVDKLNWSSQVLRSKWKRKEFGAMVCSSFFTSKNFNNDFWHVT